MWWAQVLVIQGSCTQVTAHVCHLISNGALVWFTSKHSHIKDVQKCNQTFFLILADTVKSPLQNVPFTFLFVKDKIACFPVLKTTLYSIHFLNFWQFIGWEMIYYFWFTIHFFLTTARVEWLLTVNIFSVNCLLVFFAHFVLFFFLKNIFLLVYKNCL